MPQSEMPTAPRAASPALTAILPTWDTFDAIRTTVEHLRAQTIADRIELIICAPSAERLRMDPADAAGLHSVRVLEVGELRAVGPPRARAVREASAPIIVFCEDHCFPFPNWAEILLDAHREPHAAIGPSFVNANPDNPTSWADLLVEYGRWIAPGRRGTVDLLPGHNTSYKREALLEFGEDLDRLMEAETVLLWDLRRRGRTLFFEPEARTAHTNFARLSVYLHVQWHLGRVFGEVRAERWSFLRRLGYAIASPAIPLIRLNHVIGAVTRNGLPLKTWLPCMPILLVGLVADAAGQAAGALIGAGDSVERMAALEFHRMEVNRTGQSPAAIA